VVHLFFLLVFLVVALGDLDRVEGCRFPGKADLGLFVFLCCVVDWTAGDHAADGILSGAQVRLAALVVGILDVLAYVLPGEKCAQPRYLGRVVADLEDEVVDGDGARSAPRSQLGAVLKLD
jgi:hypothetical protein